MSLEETIKELIEEQGLYFKERARSLYTDCPLCGRSDKLSILKENGATICYRGSCDFGKRWFPDWLSLTANIPIQEAKNKVYKYKDSFKERLSLNIDKEKLQVETIPAVTWPQPGFLELGEPNSEEGISYLQKRGISVEVAKYHDIRYSPWFRRVVIPVKADGQTLGWQARAIDNVSSSERMRNNPGFKREQLLMFQDELKKHKTALLFEGPFDALKFHSLGGIICSMGKNISKKQIDIINNSEVESVYLGLDQDAAEEMRQLSCKIEKNIKVLSLPDSCIERCETQGKKADFGECSVQEAREAFMSAKDLSEGHVFLNLKKFF